MYSGNAISLKTAGARRRAQSQFACFFKCAALVVMDVEAVRIDFAARLHFGSEVRTLISGKTLRFLRERGARVSIYSKDLVCFVRHRILRLDVNS